MMRNAFVRVLLGTALLAGCNLLEVGTNPPNTPTTPSGPSNGRPGIAIDFSSSATDPDTDNVCIRFSWGDGDTSAWSSAVASGATVTASHTWASDASYQVMAQAKDAEGKTSGWSGTCTITISSSGRDEEPNNTFESATLISLGDSVWGLIDTVGDLDYFKFRTPRAGVLEVAVDPVPSGIDMDVYLYNAGQEQIAYSRYTDPGQAVFLYVLRDTGLHYALLHDGGGNASSATRYNLLITLDTTDSHELNNTFSDARPIAIGADVSGKIRPEGDVDYFKFRVGHAGVLEATVDPVPTGIDMDVDLYSAGQERITYSHYTSPGQAVFVYVLRDTGLHYIMLSDGGGNAASREYYHLAVSVDSSDTFELNNTFSDARAIPLNTSLRAKIWCVGDNDYFKFTVAQAETVRVDVDTVPTTIGMRAQVYDPQQNRIAYTYEGGRGAPVHLSAYLPGSGTYHLLLSSSDASREFYTFRIVGASTGPSEGTPPPCATVSDDHVNRSSGSSAIRPFAELRRVGGGR